MPDKGNQLRIDAVSKDAHISLPDGWLLIGRLSTQHSKPWTSNEKRATFQAFLSPISQCKMLSKWLFACVPDTNSRGFRRWKKQQRQELRRAFLLFSITHLHADVNCSLHPQSAWVFCVPWKKAQESEFHLFPYAALAKGPRGPAVLTKLTACLPQGEHFITFLAQTHEWLISTRIQQRTISATRSRAEVVSESLNIRLINLMCALGTSLCVAFPPSHSSNPRWTCAIPCALERCTFHLTNEHAEGPSTSMNIMLQTKESLGSSQAVMGFCWGREAARQKVSSSSFQPPSLLWAVPSLPHVMHEATQRCSPGLSQSQADGCLMKDATNSPVHAVFEGDLWAWGRHAPSDLTGWWS